MEYSEPMDAIMHYPVAERQSDNVKPRVLYYESETIQSGAGSYTRADDRISGGRDFKLRQVYRGVIDQEVVSHVSN